MVGMALRGGEGHTVIALNVSTWEEARCVDDT